MKSREQKFTINTFNCWNHEPNTQTKNRKKNRINPKRNFLQEIKRIEK